MTSSSRALSALIIAVSPVVAVRAQTSHGASYAITTVTDSGGRKSTMSMRTASLDGKFLISMKSDMLPSTLTEMSMIYDTVAGTLTNIMRAQSTAMVMSLPMKRGMTIPFSTELSGVPKSELVDLGPGEPILGHQTRHYRHTISFGTKVTIGDLSCTKTTDEVAELWVAPDVDLESATAVLKSFAGASPSITPSMKIIDSLKNYPTKGATMKRIGTATVIGSAGDTVRVHGTFEMTELNLNAPDPKDFEVPEGFHVMDMRGMMENFSPDVLKEAAAKREADVSDRMKKSLCGAAGAKAP